jgi:hypothetical protein
MMRRCVVPLSRAWAARASNVASVILTDSIAAFSAPAMLATAGGCCGAATLATRSISPGVMLAEVRVLFNAFNVLFPSY